MEAFGLTFMLGLTAFDDIRTKRVRTIEIIVFAIIGVLIDIILKPYTLKSVLGAVAVGLFIYFVSVISREKIGKGDALITMVSGLYLGFLNLLILLWLSSILAAAFGGIYILKNKKKMDYELPFIPFMLVAYLIMYAISMLGGLFI